MKKASWIVTIVLGAALLLLIVAALVLESAWFRGWLEDQASQQLGREVVIEDHTIDWGAPVTLRLDEVRVANPDWAEDPMARLDELSVTLNVWDLMQGRIALERIDVVRPELYLLRRSDGTTNIDDLTQGEPTEEQEVSLWPEAFNVDQGRLFYRDAAQQIELDLAFDTPGESFEELSVSVRGEGHVQGEDVTFESLVHLEIEQRRGAVEGLQGRIGEGHLRGDLALDLGSDVPWISAHLEADELDLERWAGLWDNAEEPGAREPVEPQRALTERLEVLRSFEAELDLAVGQLQVAERDLRDVMVQASLQRGHLTVNRLQAREPLGAGEERLLQLVGRVEATEEEAAVIEQGRFRYRDTAREIIVEATMAAPDTAGEAAEGQRLVVQGEGQVQEDALAFEGLLYLDIDAWRGGLEGLEASFGEHSLSGSLGFDLGGDTPYLSAQLEAGAIDLDRWGLFDEAPATDATQEGQELAQEEQEVAQEEEAEEEAWDYRLARGLAWLEVFEADLDVALEELHYAGQTLHELAAEATLEDGRLNIARLQAYQQLDAEQPRSLHVQGWLEVEEEQLAADLQAQLDRIDLTAALAPFGTGELGTLDGNLNARILDGGLLFEDTALDYQAPHWGLALSFTADSVTGGVHLVGEGTYEEEPFAYDLQIGSLLDLTDPQTPYRVSGELATRDTRLWIDGSAVQPFALESVEGSVRLEGPTLSELTALTRINFPESPPYRVAGRIHYQNEQLDIEGLDGRFGESDVAGDVTLYFADRPQLVAALVSQRLQADDLLPMLGMSPATGAGETASPEQQQWEAEEQRAEILFPDREWDLEALRNTDIQLDYEAIEVQAEHVPFEDLALILELEQGVMTVEPLELGLGDGQVSASWVMDARQAALEGDLNLVMRQVNLSALLDEAGLPEVARDTLGVIGGRGAFRYRGRSMHEVMAGLGGELELAMSQGWLDIIAAELLPLNVANALVAALTGEGQVQLECTYVRFEADRGLADLDEFFMATEIAHFEGAGAINLATERMDLAFQGHNLDPTLFTGNSPVELVGSLREPEVNILTPELMTRGALSLLGAIVAPPLAILPWVDPGGGEQVGMGCEQALQEFQE